MDIVLRHPGEARRSRRPARRTRHGPNTRSGSPTARSSARTRSAHGLGTQRPVRNRPRGLTIPDLPGTATVYEPVTALPMETLPDLFVHPAGYCQNVLGDRRCWILGDRDRSGREAILIECDHPRAVERAVDRPDYHVEVAADRQDGVILRLVESVGGEVTRHAEARAPRARRRAPGEHLRLRLPRGTTILY